VPRNAAWGLLESRYSTHFQDTICMSKSRTYYVRLPCAPQRTCRAWSIDFIRPKMALSGHTKTAFVRGLGMSACYLDINARAIEDPQVYGVLEWVSARVQVLSIWGREEVGRISLTVLDSWRADHYKGPVAPLRHCSTLDIHTHVAFRTSHALASRRHGFLSQRCGAAFSNRQ
jgi:hypothetical protein